MSINFTAAPNVCFKIINKPLKYILIYYNIKLGLILAKVFGLLHVKVLFSYSISTVT